MRLALIGVVIGLASAFGLARLIATLLYGVTGAGSAGVRAGADGVDGRGTDWRVAAGAARGWCRPGDRVARRVSEWLWPRRLSSISSARRCTPGDTEAVRALLEAHEEVRALVNAPISHFKSRPIARATRNLPMLDVLLAHGADLNLKSEWWAGGLRPARRRDHARRGRAVDRTRSDRGRVRGCAPRHVRSAARTGRRRSVARPRARRRWQDATALRHDGAHLRSSCSTAAPTSTRATWITSRRPRNIWCATRPT
jgi:hypothetical protein